MAAHEVSFQGPHYAQRGFHLRPGNQIRKVPPLAVSTATLGALRWDVCEQAGCILIQITALVFENHQNVFAVRQQKIKEGSSTVERVRQDHIKGAGIGGYDSREQPPGRRHFILSRALRLVIE